VPTNLDGARHEKTPNSGEDDNRTGSGKTKNCDEKKLARTGQEKESVKGGRPKKVKRKKKQKLFH